MTNWPSIQNRWNWIIFPLLFLLLLQRLPFNAKTPIGYIFFLIFNSSVAFCVLFSIMPAICFLTGSCWLFILFAKDITNDLKLLEINGKLKRNRAEGKRRFCRIVRVYSDVKELSVMQNSNYNIEKALDVTKLVYSIVFCTGFSTNSMWFMSSKFSSFSYGHCLAFAPLLLCLMPN